MQEIAKAINNVMKEVRSIEKSADVGYGNNSYKGVNDKDVKARLQQVLVDNGLSILPTGVEAKAVTDRWEAKDFKGNPTMKQSTLTEVTTKYLLLHTSGESIKLAGYGQGVDNQDKGAGKATTYALKYALLYTFLIPTGHIDDADAVHSDSYEVKTPEKPNMSVTEAFAAIDACTNQQELTSLSQSLSATLKKDSEVIAKGIEKRKQLENNN